MNYQGVRTDPAGHPLTNRNVTVDFRIFDAERGGSMIWGTRQLVTTDSNGVFNASIGDQGDSVTGASNKVSSIQDVFSAAGADSRWLEIEVEYNHSYAMAPRQRFLSSGYAFQAGSATGSRSAFTVGKMLTVQSNVYFRGPVSIADAGQEALVFKGSVTASGSLTVSQKMSVASAMSANGPMAVHGGALFSNDTSFTQGLEFDGPVRFNNGVSFRGNTKVFGACQLLAHFPQGSNGYHEGTAPTNGFLGVHPFSVDNSSANAVIFTLGTQQWKYRAYWDTDTGDDIDFKTLTLHPVKAGTYWKIQAEASDMGYDLYYWPIP